MSHLLAMWLIQGTPGFIRSKQSQANINNSWKLQMESRIDEMCAEVKNTAQGIAELLAFMKRGVETPQGAVLDVKHQQMCTSEVPCDPEVAQKTVAHSKLS